MSVVTRFNPSCTGGLHVGHIYMVLVNAHFAHERGGSFYVRFDDRPMAHETRRHLTEGCIDRIRESMIYDLDWLGLHNQIDGFVSEREEYPKLECFCKEHGITPPPDRRGINLPLWHYQDPTAYCMPYVPRQTFDRMLYDHIGGTTHVIRGQELCSETNLWVHFCHEWGLPEPLFLYLARVEAAGGNVSKTGGSYSIAELRAKGHTPAEIIGALELGSLHYVQTGWQWPNLKQYPRFAL